MNEDPVISGGVVKAALLILVAGAIGFGAFSLADGGIDLPDVNLDDLTETGSTTTDLTDTELSDTTVGGGDAPAVVAGEGFGSASFAEAIDEVRAQAGDGRQLTRLYINGTQTQFVLVDEGSENAIEAYSVRGGEVTRESGTITISGNATIDDFAFPLDGVDPGAVDRILASAQRQTGAQEFDPTILSLERRIPFGERKLEWTINVRADGRAYLFRADAAGRDVRNESGRGTPAPSAPASPDVPSGLEDAQALGDCVAKAGQDTNAIFDCLEASRP